MEGPEASRRLPKIRLFCVVSFHNIEFTGNHVLGRAIITCKQWMAFSDLSKGGQKKKKNS